MKTLIIKLIVFLIELNIISSITYDSNSYFVNNVTIIEPDKYALYWNFTSTDITFKVVVKNTGGWIGFGLSPDGEMYGADLIVAYLNSNGSVNFTNRYALTETLPIINPIQYWNLLYYSQSNGYTTVIFNRQLQICNIPNSFSIENGTQYIIVSWGSVLNNNDITYHSTNRTSTSLPLINTLNTRISLNMTQVKTFDFRVNAYLSNESDTTYFCQMFQLPTSLLENKQHLIRVFTFILFLF
jgi:dimethyladenosine transferase 1